MAHSPVRWDVQDRCLLVTIDNPPVNVISAAVRAGLMSACEAAEAALASGAVDRVILTGAGTTFVAGADAKEFDSLPIEPHLPDVVARLIALPAVAALNGAALGGGLELALACRARVAQPGARLGLPEVTLGVVPGSGGTQRLPRLIGIEKAVALIAEGRLVTAAEALTLRLVDDIAADTVAAAQTLDGARLARPSIDDGPPPHPAPAAIEAARDQARRRMRGQTAPLRAIDLVEASAVLPLSKGLAEERRTFLELRSGDQAQALRHVFFAERQAGPPKSLGALTPAKIETALVVGGGTMGAAIAYALNATGVRIQLLETDAAAEERARTHVRGLFAEAVKRGKISEADATRRQADSFSFVHGPEAALAPADLAIEAVFEDLEIKRRLFARLDEALPKSTILATNTSYLDVNAIAEGLSHPERFVGLHFFAPAHVMKLLEIIRARETSPQTLATAFALAKQLGKIAVEAGVCDGFIGNRILTRYRQAGDILLIEGSTPADIDAAIESFGLAMGPYAVQDLSGLDIAYANRRRKNLQARTDIRYISIADHLVEDLKRLGRKSGGGWYDYADSHRTPSAEVEAQVVKASASAGIARRPIGRDEIVRRLMLAMMAEGFDILAEGIARRPADIDLVMIHGYGFPRWRGGPMHLADDWGLPTIRAELAVLAAEDPLSWRVPALLDDLATLGRSLAALNAAG